jgi:hypothetical protein
VGRDGVDGTTMKTVVIGLVAPAIPDVTTPEINSYEKSIVLMVIVEPQQILHIQ